MITINKNIYFNDYLDTEVDIDDDDIREILSQLDWNEVKEMWTEANENEKLPDSEKRTVYDSLYDEWFEKVKEKHTLKEAEKLIPIK